MEIEARIQAMSDDDRCFQLLRLAAVWALDSGMPPQRVLRNLCDWAIMGVFPDGALVTPAGDKIDPFDIFMSWKTATADCGDVALDGNRLSSSRWGPHLLESVLVSETGIRAFCERTATVLPSLLPARFRWARAGPRADHGAPPACPDAEEQAAKHWARGSAMGGTNSLREILAGLRGRPTRRGLRLFEEGPIDFDRWEKEWNWQLDNALSEARRCGDPQLEQVLRSLDAEWAGFVVAETENRASTPAPVGEDLACPADLLCAEASAATDEASPFGRTPSRFSRTALAEWYASYVARCTASGARPSRNEDCAAAKAEFGDGIPRASVRSLRRDIAPATWHQKGRRKAAAETGDKTSGAGLPK
jgi:hypothetical protein